MTALQFQPCGNLARMPRGRRAALDALDDALHWVFATLREWRRRHSERLELAHLDDRALVDIGLTRADAEYLSSKPFWRQ